MLKGETNHSGSRSTRFQRDPHLVDERCSMHRSEIRLRVADRRAQSGALPGRGSSRLRGRKNSIVVIEENKGGSRNPHQLKFIHAVFDNHL